jgi:hypothetical protein
MTQVGPSKKVSYYCNGCSFLKTEDWKFYGENDDIDSGTDATCTKENKNIASYWRSGNLAPNWCPFLRDLKDEI